MIDDRLVAEPEADGHPEDGTALFERERPLDHPDGAGRRRDQQARGPEQQGVLRPGTDVRFGDARRLGHHQLDAPVGSPQVADLAVQGCTVRG